jgi:hypothetical protein
MRTTIQPNFSDIIRLRQIVLKKGYLRVSLSHEFRMKAQCDANTSTIANKALGPNPRLGRRRYRQQINSLFFSFIEDRFGILK